MINQYNNTHSYSFLHIFNLQPKEAHTSSVYATTAGSPYVYRNFMVYTVRMGDNDMRKPRLHTKLVSTLCNSTNFSVHPRRLFLSSKCSSKVVLNDGTHFKAISWQTSELTAPEAYYLSLYMGMVLSGTF